MIPRGSNGAGQAILDANRLATLLRASTDPVRALAEYEADRLTRTSTAVLTNRAAPLDTIIREFWERTGDQPFSRIEDVISSDKLAGISRKFQQIAGYNLDELKDGKTTARHRGPKSTS